MKLKLGMSFMLLVMFSLVGTAQVKTESFKVYGNCGMCESRIEKAANAVEGVSAADWNKETKMLAITVDTTKVEVHTVMMAVAKVGHDTEEYKAEDAVYAKLHACCKYDRESIPENQ